tara:strand:- start:699 stop:1856 length:1158 start_codon:yes stop_codon:yes gene_type:complete
MSNIKKGLYIFIANILLFALIEIILTFFFVFHKSNYYGPLARLFLFEKKVSEKTVQYKMSFNKKTGMYIEGEYNFNNIKHSVNKFGFIGKEVDIENKSGCRLIALGGSTTAGVETQKPYPKILENLLNQNQLNCEVLNFGFSGKALNSLEKILVNQASKFNPNVITIMSNRNSTMYDSYITSAVATDIINSKLDLFLYELKNFLFLEIMTYRFLSLSYNRALSFLLDEENKIISPFNSRNFHSIKYFQNGYKDQIRRINSYCKEKGVKLVVIKQAFFIDLDMQKNINSLSKEEIIDKLINYNKENDYSNIKNLFWMYTNAILNKNLDEIAAKDENITLVDPTKSLYAKNKLDFFQKDGLHLNLQGNQVIANKIFESLISKQLIKK